MYNPEGSRLERSSVTSSDSLPLSARWRQRPKRTEPQDEEETVVPHLSQEENCLQPGTTALVCGAGEK